MKNYIVYFYDKKCGFTNHTYVTAQNAEEARKIYAERHSEKDYELKGVMEDN